MEANRFSPFNLTLLFIGALIFMFIIAPIISMALTVSFPQITETFKDSAVSKSIWLTIYTAMAATLVSAVFTIPLAYILAKRDFFLKKLILGIIDLPIVIPHSSAGIALLCFLSAGSPMGSFLEKIGIETVGTALGISLAMAFVSVPFLFHAAYNGFISINKRYEQIALTLGASPSRIFFSIALPLNLRNIVSGLVMMFARGMSEFGAVIIIAYYPMTTPVMIFERFSAFGLKYAVPVALIFMAVSLLIFIGLKSLSRLIDNNDE